MLSLVKTERAMSEAPRCLLLGGGDGSGGGSDASAAEVEKQMILGEVEKQPLSQVRSGQAGNQDIPRW